MPIPEQEPIEIPLGGGPSQATGQLFRGPTSLERARNVDHYEQGYLVKSRGYTRIALTTTTHGETPEAVFVGLGIDRGELVLVGHDYVYGVAANAASVDGAALVRRGPTIRGAFELGTIHGTATGDGAA